jgi:hypothetical protein
LARTGLAACNRDRSLFLVCRNITLGPFTQSNSQLPFGFACLCEFSEKERNVRTRRLHSLMNVRAFFRIRSETGEPGPRFPVSPCGNEKE